MKFKNLGPLTYLETALLIVRFLINIWVLLYVGALNAVSVLFSSFTTGWVLQINVLLEVITLFIGFYLLTQGLRIKLVQGIRKALIIGFVFTVLGSVITIAFDATGGSFALAWLKAATYIFAIVSYAMASAYFSRGK